jgi:hypothetical protein
MRNALSLAFDETSTRSHMSSNIVSLNEKLSFSSLYFVSSEYSFVKLTNSRSYPDDLIDWFTDEDDETNDWSETSDEDESDDEYSVDRL